MRNKYRCQICGEPFSRRWNMERHIKRSHHSDPELRSVFSSFHNTNDQVSKFSTFKSHNPGYYSPYSSVHNYSRIFHRSPFPENSSIIEQTNRLGTFNDLLDTWLQKLRKWAEIKRLTEELSPEQKQKPYFYPYNGAVYQSDMHQSFQSSIRMEDLEIIGYEGYVCKECLTAYPLAIYRHKFQTAKVIHTKHVCYNGRKLEIQEGQQKVNQVSILTNLFKNELPKLMLRSVREWTRGRAILMATDIPSPTNGSHQFIICGEKQWATRAIKAGSTVLTDDELSEFINIVKDCTAAYFKVQDNEMHRNSGKALFMCIGSSHLQCN
jgi:hypothetical protein